MKKVLKLGGIGDCKVEVEYKLRDDAGEGTYSHDLNLQFTNQLDSAFSNTIEIPCVTRESLMGFSEALRNLALDK